MGNALSQWVLEMMINALRMTSLHGIENLNCNVDPQHKLCFYPFYFWFSIFKPIHFSELIVTMSRRELVWPELDQLLQDDDDPTTVTTPYTAAVLEYRVVFHDSAAASADDKSWANANGHAVYDAQHPCRYERNNYFLDFLFAYLILFF